MLGIEIEDQDAAMLFAECGCEVDASGVLPLPPFWLAIAMVRMVCMSPFGTKGNVLYVFTYINVENKMGLVDPVLNLGSPTACAFSLAPATCASRARLC
jgi:hypothetical protein